MGKGTVLHWWNEDVSNLRILTRAVFNIRYRHKHRQQYKDCLKRYRLAIRLQYSGSGSTIIRTSKPSITLPNLPK